MPDKKTAEVTDPKEKWPYVVAYEGTTYRLRRVKVHEADQAYDTALVRDAEGNPTPDETLNNRINTRLQLTYAVVEPKVAMADIEEWDNALLLLMSDALRELNRSPRTPGEDSAGPASSD